MRVLIPINGKGARFKDFYKEPKPLIPIAGVPMVKRVVDNFGKQEFVFVVNKEMNDKYSIDAYLKSICDCEIVYANDTGGAACTCLLASKYMADEPLVIANCDQLMDIDLPKILKELEGDGVIFTFESVHPKWSFARVVGGRVIEIAEKRPISNHATVGIYYFKHGRDFKEGAENMMLKDMRVNNEFYVCPVYNELILKGKVIKIYEIKPEQMHGCGTPEDVKIYESYLQK